MSDRFVPVAAGWWVSNFGGVVLTGIVAARSRRPAMRALFASAVALHIGEAVYAYRSARAAGY